MSEGRRHYQLLNKNHKLVCHNNFHCQPEALFQLTMNVKSASIKWKDYRLQQYHGKQNQLMDNGESVKYR